MSPAESKSKIVLTVQLFLATEFVLLLIATLMTIVPGRTGKKSRLAEYFIENPDTLDQILTHWLLGNILVGILGVIIALWWYASGRKARSDDPA